MQAGDHTDPDKVYGDTLTVHSVGGATNGAVVLNTNGTVTFTPTANYNGPASFTYQVKDTKGAVSANTATVSITVNEVNDNPTITSITLGLDSATGAITYTLSVTDDTTVPSDLIVSVTPPAQNTGTISTPTYNPATSTWTFTYTPTQAARLLAGATAEEEATASPSRCPTAREIPNTFTVNSVPISPAELLVDGEANTPISASKALMWRSAPTAAAPTSPTPSTARCR